MLKGKVAVVTGSTSGIGFCTYKGGPPAASASGQRGASPLQACPLRPVADRNCVAARRGGEQREASESSVAYANSIRPSRLASLLSKGEAQT
jgi:hypothetical protein